MWQLEGFLDEIDRWIAEELPPEEWVTAALSWTQSLMNNPWPPCTRDVEAGPDAWVAEISRASDADRMTVCWYRVDEDDRWVRCRLIHTVPRPKEWTPGAWSSMA